jgi:hypothetical protein
MTNKHKAKQGLRWREVKVAVLTTSLTQLPWVHSAIIFWVTVICIYLHSQQLYCYIVSHLLPYTDMSRHGRSAETLLSLTIEEIQPVVSGNLNTRGDNRRVNPNPNPKHVKSMPSLIICSWTSFEFIYFSYTTPSLVKKTHFIRFSCI